jgi:hypothetical protein
VLVGPGGLLRLVAGIDFLEELAVSTPWRSPGKRYLSLLVRPVRSRIGYRFLQTAGFLAPAIGFVSTGGVTTVQAVGSY